MYSNDRLFALAESRNITDYRLATDLGYSRAKVSAWRTKGTSPTINALIQLADYFDVSIDYLAGRTDKPEVNR